MMNLNDILRYFQELQCDINTPLISIGVKAMDTAMLNTIKQEGYFRFTLM